MTDHELEITDESLQTMTDWLRMKYEITRLHALIAASAAFDWPDCNGGCFFLSSHAPVRPWSTNIELGAVSPELAWSYG